MKITLTDALSSAAAVVGVDLVRLPSQSHSVEARERRLKQAMVCWMVHRLGFSFASMEDHFDRVGECLAEWVRCVKVNDRQTSVLLTFVETWKRCLATRQQMPPSIAIHARRALLEFCLRIEPDSKLGTAARSVLLSAITKEPLNEPAATDEVPRGDLQASPGPDAAEEQ